MLRKRGVGNSARRGYMSPVNLVPKYIVHRDAVLQDENSFDALTNFGRSETSILALEQGADYLMQQLYGNNLIFLVVPDESQRELDLVFKVSSLPLNGSDATKMLNGVFPEDESGIIWRSFKRDSIELVSSVNDDEDYLEFSRNAKSVYTVPIRSQSGPLGVFCIDTSDPQNIKDPRILTMINNFVELIFICLLNSKIAKLEELRITLKAGMAHLDEIEDAQQEYRRYSALATTWPAGPAILMVLSKEQKGLDDLKTLLPKDDLLDALFKLHTAHLVEFRKTSFVLTDEGKQLILKFNKIQP